MWSLCSDPDRATGGQWHRDGITDPFAELWLSVLRGRSLKSYVSGNPWMRPPQAVSEFGAAWVNEAASSRLMKPVVIVGAGLAGLSRPNRHVGGHLGGTPAAQKAEGHRPRSQEPVDASQIFLTEFGLP